MRRTLLIMAGGTGGHIFPGLAVAEQARAAGWQVVWMGARGGMEERLVPRHGYAAAWIRARAARGKGVLQKLLLPANLLFSFWESASHIRRIRPDVVLGLGGYVAFPGGMMASLLGRPLALHEQNAIPGLANRVLAGVSDKVMVAFPDTLARAEWTGNPVRADIAAIAQPEERFRGREGPLKLLVVGGSRARSRCSVSDRWSFTSLVRNTWTACARAMGPPTCKASSSPSSMTWRDATPRPIS